jgi:uncharacterized protein with von Willebrand factor type A (vWA) domain
VIDLLAGFIQELRRAGLPVSLTEDLDAMEAIKHIPLEDREAFKYALAATLVKSAAHWKAFETVFEVYFSMRGREYTIGDSNADAELQQLMDDLQSGEGDQDGMSGEGGGGMEALTPEELAEMLYKAMLNADEAMMRAVARQAVKRFAGMEPGRPVGGTYYLYRTLRNLDLDGVVERMMEAAREQAGGELTPLEERLERDEAEIRSTHIKQEVEAEIRRRLVADRGVDAMARTLRKPLPEDVDFMHASREEMTNLKKALQPLTRSSPCAWPASAATVARGASTSAAPCATRSATAGCRRSRSSSTPRPAKPEIFVVADISGSVAAFARFTLQLVYAISGQFSKVRAFVFIDGLDEVTSFFEGEEDINQAVHRVNTEADVVWVDGHSDYGHALEVFHEKYGHEVGPRTTVLLLGDARNNYHASQSWVVKELRHKARHVYWLNPEPKSYWDTGDSIVGEYATHCDGVYECRNLRQLERFVEVLT